MAEFLFAYHGGSMPETSEEVEAIMARWQAWITELGDKMVNPGNPVGISKYVTAEGLTEGEGVNALSGFSIVRADDMDAALELTKGCPHLDDGTIEVAEIIEL